MSITYQEIKNKLMHEDRKLADDVNYYKNISEESKSQFLQNENIEELKSVSNVSKFIDRFYKIYQSNSLVVSAEVANAYAQAETLRKKQQESEQEL